MKRWVSFKDINHEEWLKYRKKGITGTDAGAIVGMNPYRSAFAVYQDKITEEIEQSDNEAMRQGRDMEDYVAQRFMEATGLKVRRANAIFYNEEHPFMLADFDRIIVGQKAGLECKTVSPYSSDKWEDGKIPLHYQMQVQHYLAVSGFECWYVAALIYGREFIIRKIEKDEELIQNLITIEERFWKENVLAHVMPDPDGSDDCSKHIQALYNTDSNTTVTLYGCNELLERRDEITGLIKKLETEKNTIEQQVKLQMKDSAYGITDKFRISWASFVSNRLDTKKLKAEKPDIYQAYCTSNPSRRFTVSMA